MTTEVIELEQKALAVPDQARIIQVTDNPSYVRATDILLAIKGLRRQINDTFDPIIEKAHMAHKEAIDQKKKIDFPLVTAEGILKPRIALYLDEQERKRREEERLKQEEANRKAEDERLRLAAEAESKGRKEEAQRLIEEPVEAPVVIVPKDTPKVSGISMRKVWKYRIKDASQIKRAYLIPDDVKIGQVVRAMGALAAESIGGIEVYEESVIAAGRE